MQFSGLVWVTSWISFFLASSQGLLKVPDYLATAFPSRVFSVVNSPIEIPTSLLFQTQFYSGVGSSNYSFTTIPNLAFQMGAGSSQFRPQSVQAAVRPSFRFKAPENTVCHPESELAKESRTVATTPSSLSVAKQETSPREVSKASFSQQILQVMQNLLPWRQRVEKSLASSVEVVSTHSGDRVGDKQNGEEQRVKRGFWRYSQLLATRAFAASPPTEREQFQAWVKGHLIAQLPSHQQADMMAQRLKQFLHDPSKPCSHASPVEPKLVDGLPAVKVGDRVLFKVDDTLARDLERNGELLAIEWTNNLRTALGKEPLKLVEAQKRLYNLVETPRTFKGEASWYGSHFHGRLTATGETYNQHELTAAHPSLPFDTYLKVRNLKSGNSVIVRINDRGPFLPDKNRNLDLSREAARWIGSEKAGIIPFEAVIMQPPSAQS